MAWSAAYILVDKSVLINSDLYNYSLNSQQPHILHYNSTFSKGLCGKTEASSSPQRMQNVTWEAQAKDCSAESMAAHLIQLTRKGTLVKPAHTTHKTQ